MQGCDAGGYHEQGPNPLSYMHFERNVVASYGGGQGGYLLTGMGFARPGAPPEQRSTFDANIYTAYGYSDDRDDDRDDAARSSPDRTARDEAAPDTCSNTSGLGLLRGAPGGGGAGSASTAATSCFRFGYVFLGECYDWRSSVSHCDKASANASSLSQWQRLGFDRNSLLLPDPRALFRDPPRDFRLKEAQSPAVASLGLRPLDTQGVGVVRDALLGAMGADLPAHSPVFARYPFTDTASGRHQHRAAQAQPLASTVAACTLTLNSTRPVEHRGWVSIGWAVRNSDNCTTDWRVTKWGPMHHSYLLPLLPRTTAMMRLGAAASPPPEEFSQQTRPASARSRAHTRAALWRDAQQARHTRTVLPHRHEDRARPVAHGPYDLSPSRGL